MKTERELSTLLGSYLEALGEADRLEKDGLADEARKRRKMAAPLLAAISRGWPLEQVEAAYRQQMDLIFADWQSAHDRCAPRRSVTNLNKRPEHID